MYACEYLVNLVNWVHRKSAFYNAKLSLVGCKVYPYVLVTNSETTDCLASAPEIHDYQGYFDEVDDDGFEEAA